VAGDPLVNRASANGAMGWGLLHARPEERSHLGAPHGASSAASQILQHRQRLPTKRAGGSVAGEAQPSERPNVGQSGRVRGVALQCAARRRSGKRLTRVAAAARFGPSRDSPRARPNELRGDVR